MKTKISIYYLMIFIFLNIVNGCTENSLPKMPPPLPPQNVTLKKVGDHIIINWEKVVGVTHYKIQAFESASWETIHYEPPFTHFCANNGFVYKYCLSSVGPGGESEKVFVSSLNK